jgi:hypothetical protein
MLVEFVQNTDPKKYVSCDFSKEFLNYHNADINDAYKMVI